MRFFVCLALLMAFSISAAANPSAQNLQNIRSIAFSISSELLLYYNPNQDGGDPQNEEGYKQRLNSLLQLVSEDTSLQQSANSLRDRIQSLERQPASQAVLRPIWINPILEAQADLDLRASMIYDKEQVAKPLRKRHALQLNVARLLLLYETRTFGSLAVYLMKVDSETLNNLDRQILEGFDEVSALGPVNADPLASMKIKYLYIRPRLLNHELGWVPGGAFYYLNAIERGLAELD